MAKKGIVIDVGFKADVESFVSDIEKDFGKIDFDSMVDLEKSFEKQEKKIVEKLKELKKTIDDTINGNMPNDPSSQLRSLNRAVSILGESMKELIKNMPSDQASSYSGVIDNITNSVKGLTSTCQGALDVVEDLNNTGINTNFVDSSGMNDLKNLYKLLRNTINEIRDLENIRPVNENGNSPYKNEEKVIEKIIEMYERAEKARESYQSAENDKDMAIFGQQYLQNINSALRLMETLKTVTDDYFQETFEFKDESFGFDELFKSLKEDAKLLREDLFGIMNGINTEYQMLGGKDLEIELSKKVKKPKINEEDGLKIPVVLDEGNSLKTQALSLIKRVQNNIDKEPLQVHVQLISDYKSRQNREILKEISSNIGNIDNEEIRGRMENLMSDLESQIKESLLLDVKLNTESASNAIREFKEQAIEELKSLSESVPPIEPEIVLTGENREKFQQQLDEMQNGYAINISVNDGIDDTEENSSRAQLKWLLNIKKTLEKLKTAVGEKSLAFIEEEGIVKDVMANESGYLNILYGDLVAIEEEIKDVSNAFLSIPDSMNKGLSKEFIASLSGIADNGVLKEILNAKESINAVISEKSSKTVSISEEDKEKLLSDLRDIKKEIKRLFSKEDIKEWASIFINNLDEIEKKITSLPNGIPDKAVSFDVSEQLEAINKLSDSDAFKKILEIKLNNSSLSEFTRLVGILINKLNELEKSFNRVSKASLGISTGAKKEKVVDKTPKENTAVDTKKELSSNSLVEMTKSISKEREKIDEVITSEIKNLKELESTITGVTNAINAKTEAFIREGKTVKETVNSEVSDLNPLKSLGNTFDVFKKFYDNGDLESEAGAAAALSYYQAYKDAIESKVSKKELKQYTVENMNDLFSGNYANYKKGTGELDLSGINSQIEKYQGIINSLNTPEVVNVINSITDAIENMLSAGNNSDKMTEWLTALNKTINNLSGNKSADKINTIATNFENLQKAISKIDISDSGFVESLNNILAKSGELKALAAILKSSDKKITSTQKAVESKNKSEKASIYLREHFSGINEAIAGRFEGSEILDANFEATKEGFVKVVALIREATGEYKKYTLAIDENGNIQDRAINVRQDKLAKEAADIETYRNALKEESPFTYGKSGETFKPGDENWDELVAKMKTFGLELENIDKIIRTVERDGRESFQVFTDFSRVTVGRDSENVLYQKDTVIDKDAIQSFKDEVLSLSSIMENAFKDPQYMNRFIDRLNDVKRKLQEIKSLEKNGVINSETYDGTISYIVGLQQSMMTKVDNIDLSKSTDEVKQQYALLKKTLNELLPVFQKIDSEEPFSEEDISLIKRYRKEYENFWQMYKSDSGKLSSPMSGDKLLGKISDSLTKNSGMGWAYREQYEKLAREISAMGENIPSDKIKEFSAQFFKLERQIKEAGLTGKSFFDMIRDRAKGMSASFVAQFFSFYDLIRYAREAITVVKELDTAMIELRKVTSGTEKEYAKFADTIDEYTKAVASTHAELISSSADWARLGK